MQRIKRIWMLAPLLCVPLAALAVARVQNQHRSTAYKRFISPPLGNGTLYTFLYPTRYRTPMVSGSDVLMHDNWRPTPLESLRMRLHLSPKPLGASFEELTVNVEPQEGTPKDSREAEAEDPSSPFHNIVINEARSKRQFSLTHINYSHASEVFDRESKVVSDSFQILRPGTPTPAP